MHVKSSITIFLCFSMDITVSHFFYNPFGKITQKDTKDTVQTLPWCGILRVKQQGKMDAATGLILIAKGAALACADDVANINKSNLRKRTRAIFFTSTKSPSVFKVADFILHPEYNDKTKNTFAIVKLVKNFPLFVWQPIKWPNISHSISSGKLFSIGYSDDKKVLEQKKYQMVQVNKISCMDFYHIEGMTFQELWPSHFECYKRMRNAETCVDDAGMALAHNDGKQWTLIGMSTYGPGCILPARYIQFAPYIPWIKNTLEMKQRKSDFQSFRRNIDRTAKKRKTTAATSNLEEITDALRNEEYEDKMQFHLDRINDNKTLIMTAGPMNETIGVCLNTSLYHTVYGEHGKFDVGHGKPGRALFALSLMDLSLHEVPCIIAVVNSTKHSKIIAGFERGFKQDDDILEFSKRVPITKLKGTVPPKVVSLSEYGYKHYRDLPFRSLYFRFEFVGTAYIQVEVKSVVHVPALDADKMTDQPPDLLSSTPRPKRNYTTYMRPGSNTAWRFPTTQPTEKKKEEATEARRYWGLEASL